MNILNKFDNVKIENNTRISADDYAFCESQQELYFKVLENYINIYNEILKIIKKENSQFEEIKEANSYELSGISYRKYDYHFLTISKEDFTKVILGVHTIFINTILDYFKKKYGVKLETKTISDITGLQEPEQEDGGCYGVRGYSKEDIEKFKEKNIEYRKALNKYRDKIIETKIDFNAIVDNIFIQLGGYSFTDKVKKEIIDDCKYACFNEYRKFNYTELKKDKIIIKVGFNSGFDRIWEEYIASTNNKYFKAIMRALTFFDSGENNTAIYDGWQHSFIYYSKKEKEGIYGLHCAYGKKVESFKFYKNGKWEVKFSSQEEARTFFNIYCKSEV